MRLTISKSKNAEQLYITKSFRVNKYKTSSKIIKKIKTTNKTKITVILATYRNVERLESIIKDLYNQSFQEFEIIVVDDQLSITI